MPNRPSSSRRRPQSRLPVLPPAKLGLPMPPGAMIPPRPPASEPPGSPRGWYNRPPFRVRFWRWLGFGEKYAARPETPEFTEGYDDAWHVIATIGLLDWKDRLRALISGRIMVHQAMRTDAKVTKFTNTAAVSVLPPGKMPPRMEKARQAAVANVKR